MKVRKRWIRFLVFLVFLFLQFTAFSQEIYFLYGMLGQNTPSIVDNLEKWDIVECKLPEIHNFNSESNLPGISPRSLSFHPDGLLYLTTKDYLIGFNVLTRKIEKKIRVGALDRKAALAISEEGEMLISNRNTDYGYIYFPYDLRKERVTGSYTPQELMGDSGLALAIGGYLDGGDLLFFFDATATPGSYPYFPNSLAYWNADKAQVDTMAMNGTTDYTFATPSVYRPADGSLEMFAAAYYEGLISYALLRIQTEDRTMAEPVCSNGLTSLFRGLHTDNLSFPLFYKIAHETGFRQSSLRIVLDADRSSGHMTAGYYDTLTACRQAIPIADEDIELYTGGGEVDFISFRLRYYDEPRLPVEEIFSEEEEYEDQLKRTSPSRWVWQNPYGTDTARIKDFLRTVRYRAQWDPGDPDQSRERVVMTTMHAGRDSTTSWSVYQLEQQNEVNAGRDTTALYCFDSASIDLEEYLSPEASREGRIEPELSAGGLVFTPGIDEAGKYIYIVEVEECADTAVLELRELDEAAVGLDTVFLCPGDSRTIGFPPGQYGLRWWDGSRGDSIRITETDAGSRRVSVDLDGLCGVQVDVEVVVSDMTDMAGEDLMITYCAGDPEIRLIDTLPIWSGMEWRIDGLSGDDGIFRPGLDAAGDYLYIVSAGSCADTAVVTLTVSPDQEVMPGDVVLCADEKRRIGFPAGAYEKVLWEDGTEGDSVWVGHAQEGMFGFEAWQSGCRYYGAYEVRVSPELDFPAIYPDTLRICAGEQRSLPVEELDSLLWDGSLFYPGDKMKILVPGELLFRGYRNGCSAEKKMIVEEVTDPSESYRTHVELRGEEGTEIRLPENTDLYRFSWKDGTVSTSRYIDLPGDYAFLIETTDCIYESAIEVIPDPDCHRDEELSCQISLPNVIVPNGENHTLKVYATCEIQVLEIRVYDKWGGLRYSTSMDRVDYSVWENLLSDVYLVVVTYEQEGLGIRELVGTVMVVK